MIHTKGRISALPPGLIFGRAGSEEEATPLELCDLAAGVLGTTGAQAALSLWIVAWGFVMYFWLKRMVRTMRDVARVATYAVTILLWCYGSWTVAHLLAAR